MDTASAVTMAAEVAEREGYDVRQYDFRIKRTSTGWEIDYMRKRDAKPGPGDFFSIHVDERTESVRIGYGK